MLQLRNRIPLSMCHMRKGTPNEVHETGFTSVGSLMLPPGDYTLIEIANPHNADFGNPLALRDPAEVFGREKVEDGDVVFINRWTLVHPPKKGSVELLNAEHSICN